MIQKFYILSHSVKHHLPTQTHPLRLYSFLLKNQFFLFPYWPYHRQRNWKPCHPPISFERISLLLSDDTLQRSSQNPSAPHQIQEPILNAHHVLTPTKQMIYIRLQPTTEKTNQGGGIQWWWAWCMRVIDGAYFFTKSWFYVLCHLKENVWMLLRDFSYFFLSIIIVWFIFQGK